MRIIQEMCFAPRNENVELWFYEYVVVSTKQNSTLSVLLHVPYLNILDVHIFVISKSE